MFRSWRLIPSRNLVFVISLALAVLAVTSVFFPVPVIGRYVSGHRFWLVTGAYGLLAAGVLTRKF